MSFLPELAKHIALWFPELDGRAIAVADAKITRQNMPTLPLVMLCFANELPGAAQTSAINISQRSQFELVDEFVIEFWLQPNRYVKEDNVESPFWSYYDYEAIRNRLLSALYKYTGSNNERIWYRGLSQEVDEFAEVLVFTMQARYNWCPDEEIIAALSEVGEIIDDKTFSFNLCAPKTVFCPPETKPDESLDDCDRRAAEAEQRRVDATGGT